MRVCRDVQDIMLMQCSPTPFNRLPTAMLNPGAAIPPQKNIFYKLSLLHKPFLSEYSIHVTGPNLVAIGI
jgi:hypothetical protein